VRKRVTQKGERKRKKEGEGDEAVAYRRGGLAALVACSWWSAAGQREEEEAGKERDGFCPFWFLREVGIEGFGVLCFVFYME
jgi:hypothetical protein